MVTLEGNLYTLGTGEQGQLGRVAEIFSNRGGRQGLGKSSGNPPGPPAHFQTRRAVQPAVITAGARPSHPSRPRLL